MIEFNINSTQHMSCILFGGNIKEKVIEPIMDAQGFPVIVKSTGNLKTHKVQKSKYIAGFNLIPLEEWKTKTGFYSTNENVIKYLLLETEGDAKALLELLHLIRKKEKQLATYYDATLDCIYAEDECVHPNFGIATTGTGRLSCSNPNIQNQPDNDKIVKEHFISRHHDGVLMEADWKGIEPRIEAQLSGDKGKINDILQGVDDHTKNLSLKEHMEYTKVASLVETSKEWVKKRKAVKGLTFVWQYGGGDKKAAKASGLPLNEVKILKQARIDAYPSLYRYYDILGASVEKNGGYKDPWGIRYKFKRFPSKNKFGKQGKLEYSYNQVINYRTQGFATGTIVLSMIGIFWRKKALMNRDKYLMINTVHDSLVLDVTLKGITQAKEDLTLLETAPILSKEVFKYEFKVLLPIDIKWGKTWAECE